MSRLNNAIKKAQDDRDLKIVKAGVLVIGAGSISNIAAHGSASDDTAVWEQRIAQEREKLLASERSLIAQDWEQVNVASQVALQEQLIEQLQNQLSQMQKKMVKVTQDQTELQAVHDTSAERLAQLQKCHTVTQELQVSHQELDVSTYILERIGKSQERLNHEQDRHLQRTKILKQNLEELQQQLSGALDAIEDGTTPHKQKELHNDE